MILYVQTSEKLSSLESINALDPEDVDDLALKYGRRRTDGRTTLEFLLQAIDAPQA